MNNEVGVVEKKKSILPILFIWILFNNSEIFAQLSNIFSKQDVSSEKKADISLLSNISKICDINK